MRCQQSQEWISSAMDGELGSYERSQLLEHLDSCVSCLEHQNILLKGQQALRNSMVSPSENFEWKVQLGIQRALREKAAAVETPSSRGKSFWIPMGLSASMVAALVVVLGASWILQEPTLLPSSPLQNGAGMQTLAENNSVSPDLSGASPGANIEFTGGGFGIRTVGLEPASNPRFQQNLYSPSNLVQKRTSNSVPVRVYRLEFRPNRSLPLHRHPGQNDIDLKAASGDSLAGVEISPR